MHCKSLIQSVCQIQYIHVCADLVHLILLAQWVSDDKVDEVHSYELPSVWIS